nr:MAG TPA: hypothetical protein [Crassvirales sp.]
MGIIPSHPSRNTSISLLPTFNNHTPPTPETYSVLHPSPFIIML